MSVFAEQVNAHGLRHAYLRYAPNDPLPPDTDTDPVVLMHGLAGSSRTWLPLLAELARRGYRGPVIAPDGLGHGDSSKPRTGDYSLAAQATAVRDLVLYLGYQRVTLVGHSLGGGVCLQFAYQFPEHIGRIVLVASGGLGRAVSPVIRAALLPGAGAALAVVLNRATGAALERRSTGWQHSEARELGRHLASLADPDARRAFRHEVRSALDFRGQRLTATDRLYLTDAVPALLIWGGRDRIIPPEHGEQAAGRMPGSKLVVFPSAGHFPHCAEPRKFADAMLEFLDTTTPARLNSDDVRKLIALAANQPSQSQ